LIANVHQTLEGLSVPAMRAADQVEKPTPAQVKKSITPDALISFEDGKPYKTLRRHLSLRGLSAEAYRAKYGLPADYPMTCTSYSAQRSELARSLGLGNYRKAAAKAAEPDETASEAPKRRDRKPKAA
ncbi:MAG: MucR family transcriptional regulator, partial [Oxalobacteraceae bacterium]